MNKRIGLVACSKTKLTTPAPAYLMYSKSPRFTQLFCAAKSICDTVYILSAKHGAVKPEVVLNPYDCYLPDQSQDYIDEWAKSCHKTIKENHSHYYSYLPSSYREPLAKYISFEYILDGSIFDVATKLGKTEGNLRGCEGVMEWCIEAIYRAKVLSLNEIKNMYIVKGYKPATVKAQLDRLKKHPLIIVSGQYVRYKYLRPSCTK